MIYFISQGEDGPIKIGYTQYDDAKGRLLDLQTGSPIELILLGTKPGDPEDEDRLHEKLDRFKIRGEWFQRCEEVLRELNIPVESGLTYEVAEKKKRFTIVCEPGHEAALEKLTRMWACSPANAIRRAIIDRSVADELNRSLFGCIRCGGPVLSRCQE